MIVSASYKTDIPAFYGDWFLNRLHAGYCKNLGPFLDKLAEVHTQGYPFIIQYTINCYPRKLEFSVTDATRSIRHAAEIARRYGSRTLVWRYDPVVFSSETPAETHLENFEWLASRLGGMTDEVVISFAQIYRKTRRNMDSASHEFGFEWSDPDDEQKRKLMREFLRLARAHQMQLTLCSQPYLLEPGVQEAHCVDARRISALLGREIHTRLKGARKECGCFESKDIGDYDTCPHGCVYCYAVLNRKLAQKRYREHDPESEFLFGTGQPAAAETSPSLF